MFDSLVVIVVVFMGLRDDRRAPGTPQTSLFRTTDDDPAPTAAARSLGEWEQPHEMPTL